MSLIRNTFKRLHYPVDIIAQCVRWYPVYSLSLRNLAKSAVNPRPVRGCQRLVGHRSLTNIKDNYRNYDNQTHVIKRNKLLPNVPNR